MTGSERAAQYADDVLSGAIPAPKTIIQACQRFANDLERDDIYLNIDHADMAVKIIESMKHVKGKWQGKNIELGGWQAFIVVNIFGWKWTKNNKRRFRYVYKQVPRKNGKSLLAICIALLLFAADGEKGAEVYLGATSQDQAKKLLFLPAKQILKLCDEFRESYGIEINASSLVKPEDFSRLEYVIKKPDDGTSPHCAIVDEYHLHDTTDQYEVFDTGMGAREQPLLMVTTTAGTNLSGPCKEMHGDCKKILSNQAVADTLFIMIYEPDEDDDWDDVATLRKVNPNIGISVDEDYLLDQLSQARRSATKQSSFKTKHLNMWVGAKNQWMNMLAWQRQKKNLDINNFKHLPCQIGMDLASKKDLCHLSIVFYDESNGKYYTFQRSYIPEAAHEDNDSYRQFVDHGWLTETEGNMTDYEYIERDILQLCSDFNVESIAYDPYQATYLVTNLQKHGLELIEFGQSMKNMSEPMQQIEALTLNKQFFHDGNPCMTWMVGNTVAYVDSSRNQKPNKEKKDDDKCKIDGVVALIMAMGRWLVPEGEKNPYESRGLRFL